MCASIRVLQLILRPALQYVLRVCSHINSLNTNRVGAISVECKKILWVERFPLAI